eukprot:759517-Hanusia_phi.AAC.1
MTRFCPSTVTACLAYFTFLQPIRRFSSCRSESVFAPFDIDSCKPCEKNARVTFSSPLLFPSSSAMLHPPFLAIFSLSRPVHHALPCLSCSAQGSQGHCDSGAEEKRPPGALPASRLLNAAIKHAATLTEDLLHPQAACCYLLLAPLSRPLTSLLLPTPTSTLCQHNP